MIGLAQETTAEAAYEEVTERLQAICERFGCPPGSNRLDWIESQFEEMRTLLLAAAQGEIKRMVEAHHHRRGDRTALARIRAAEAALFDALQDPSLFGFKRQK